MTFYNENNPNAAAWLRELIARKEIPDGVVDERSITEIKPHEIAHFTHQHFFAGIGGWPLALRLAGWPDDRPVRTGSCPCQPFSTAGLGKGEEDERHLFPVFRNLIAFGEPTVTFGEQVASPAGRKWLAGVRADMEGLGYAFGAADLCAASIHSPQNRPRLWWVADPRGERFYSRRRTSGNSLRTGLSRNEPESDGITRGLANSNGKAGAKHERESGIRSRRTAAKKDSSERRGNPRGMADSDQLNDDGAGSRSGNDRRKHRERRLSNREDLSVGMAIAGGDRSEAGVSGSEQGEERGAKISYNCGRGLPFGMGDSNGSGSQKGSEAAPGARHGSSTISASQWSRARWIPCRDGKHRRIPVEPALFPLADGLPYKLDRRRSIRPALLEGIGNAIVPELAAEFIIAFLEASE